MSHTANRPDPRPSNADTIDTPGPVGRKVAFWFESRKLEGLEGESIAKALFRNGVRTLSHSVKYGRPRGIHCGRGRCTMCHVEVDGVTGVKSCITPLAEGMRINHQHYKPFYGSLITAALRRVSLPAGFYYRWFTRPRLVRNAFVATIRRVAGVGRVDDRPQPPRVLPPPPDALTELRGRYEVVVVGAGISGLAAAVGAAEAGADVLLVDEYRQPGGHSIGRLSDTGLASARDDLIRRAEGAALKRAAGITAQGYYDPGRVLLGRDGKGADGGGLRIVSGDAFVFATGAQDLIPLFENNDLPGIFGSRGLRLFLERDGLVPGRRAVVYGAGPELASCASLLDAWGVRLEGVVCVWANGPAGVPAGVRTVTGARLVGASGREWIERAAFDTGAGDRLTLSCDLLCVAVPGQPSFELAQQAGFRFELRVPDGVGGNGDLKVMVPTSDVASGAPERFLVGEASGRFDWKTKIEHAAAAGRAAANRG
jgi:sarcosine oxidase subunit alpha